MSRTLNGLLQSRKFYLACFGAIQSLVFHYIEVDPVVWQSIDALVIVLIAAIAHEDAAEKKGGAFFAEQVALDELPEFPSTVEFRDCMD